MWIIAWFFIFGVMFGHTYWLFHKTSRLPHINWWNVFFCNSVFAGIFVLLVYSLVLRMSEQYGTN